ncbi:addiction module antidote protein [Desulfatirhabdium butyrativorans]|uniref:addiction module antidote protein n=1 Tax=Desulfatirhabdium butyrativorans TaxID=340467 RepID=UPI00041E779D|nr:addiction module antidote protein [Desulfatirhabdium butyrativorans]
MTKRLAPFDMASFLDSEEAIAEYLSQVLADGNPDELLAAIGHIAKARGMSQIARDSGLARESLYKAMTPGAKPRFDTIMKILNTLGVHLQVAANVCHRPTNR